MKVNLTIRMNLCNVEIGDHLDPKLHSTNRWRTRYGHFCATEGPAAQRTAHSSYTTDVPPFVAEARRQLDAILAEYGADAFSGYVEIVQERVGKE